MIVLSQNTLRGPNYWSRDHKKLIQTRVQVEPDFTLDASSESILLSFISKHVSDFEMLKNTSSESKNLACIASIALALQSAAGSKLNFWLCKETAYQHVYNVLIEYEFEEVGLMAIEESIALFSKVVTNFSEIESAIHKIKRKLEQEQPSTKISTFISLANSYAVPYLLGEQAKSIQLGYGKNSQLLDEHSDIEQIKLQLENGTIARIPILAISGSNGKTTTTRLVSHMLKTDGKSVGFTTSDGIYINNEMVDEGDTTGPISAQVVLSDKRVEIAVLESARGGIVRAGLGFDTCDLAIVTNVQDDHLGISDIETMDQLAQVKNVIVDSVKNGGCAILNAENTYTRKMGANAISDVAWFCINSENTFIKEAIQKGKTVAYVENEKIIVHQNNEKKEIAFLHEVPITFNGTLGFMIENVLAATLAASIYGLKTEIISEALKTFYPSPEQTPGRMNIFEINGNQLLVDFAHNPDGFAGIRDFLTNVKSDFKIGIIVGTGDRKDEDTIELGRISAQMFDLTLIHQVKFLRGKNADDLVELIVEGIHKHSSEAKWMRIPDTEEPLAFALKQANGNSYIVALSDVLTDINKLVKKYQQH